MIMFDVDLTDVTVKCYISVTRPAPDFLSYVLNVADLPRGAASPPALPVCSAWK